MDGKETRAVSGRSVRSAGVAWSLTSTQGPRLSGLFLGASGRTGQVLADRAHAWGWRPAVGLAEALDEVAKGLR